MTKILVVEDEAPIRNGLLALFESQGFAAHGVADGAAALDCIEDGWDLVVLDLMIPRIQGLEVLRRARDAGFRAPVLVLTAKGEEDDVVAGLEAGADDYVTKPFGVKELVARAKGLLRRAPVDDEPTRLHVGAVELDLDGLCASHGEQYVRLTAREARLLQYLITRRHRPVSREELLVDVWGYTDGSIRTRTVDVHVQQLRAKLEPLPAGASWIQTVRGRGYRFGGEVT